jgi:hypothetical protein
MIDNSNEDSTKTSAEERFFLERKRQGFINVVEVVAVFFAANIIILSGMFDSTLSHIIPDYYDGFFRIPAFSKALFITVLHIIFTVVYGISPLQLTYRRLLNPTVRTENKAHAGSIRVGRNNFKEAITSSQSNGIPSKSSAVQNETAESYLKELIFSSQSLSRNIYNRGSLYLMIGLICAFAGIAFFYSQAHVVDSSKTPSQQILSILPNFGVLFFLELVAFFFLRQYRTVMDEFRYYEAIKRSREETLAIIKFTLESGKEVDLAEVIEKGRLGGNPNKLEAGQSTEILESRKLDKSELETLSKLVETVVSKLGQGTK